MRKLITAVGTSFLLFVLVLLAPASKVSAHCDTLDGPVIAAARKALDGGNANLILIWVKAENDEEIRKALKKARDKRKAAKTKEEKEKADMELFETLVRIHREGEGAKYEGIKPAGSIEPEIALADKAVETGRLDKVLLHIKSPENREIIKHLFHKVKGRSNYDINNVSAGREFIEAYVTFIHTLEKAIKGLSIDSSHPHYH